MYISSNGRDPIRVKCFLDVLEIRHLPYAVAKAIFYVSFVFFKILAGTPPTIEIIGQGVIHHASGPNNAAFSNLNAWQDRSMGAYQCSFANLNAATYDRSGCDMDEIGYTTIVLYDSRCIDNQWWPMVLPACTTAR